MAEWLTPGRLTSRRGMQALRMRMRVRVLLSAQAQRPLARQQVQMARAQAQARVPQRAPQAWQGLRALHRLTQRSVPALERQKARPAP